MNNACYICRRLHVTFELTSRPNSLRKKEHRLAVWWSDLCTPGMGVILWGASPLYVNPVTVVRQENKY